MSNIYTSVEQLIGKTPLVELTNIEKKYDLKAKLLAKVESFNPGGSAKDRVAKAMLDDAEERGILTKDSVIIEPTSGNTGIGLASIKAIACASSFPAFLIIIWLIFLGRAPPVISLRSTALRFLP